MTELAHGPENTPGDPLTAILGKAITAVPAVKYALGVVGVAAAAALITTYFKSGLTAAIVGTALLLVAMILLRVFARLASTSEDKPGLGYAALFLAWVFVLLFCGFGILTTSCVFFDRPKPYPLLVRTLISPLSNSEPRPPSPSQSEVKQAVTRDIRIVSTTAISSLPDSMKTVVGTAVNEDSLRSLLHAHGSLTVDGAALVVGPIGEGTSATLAVDVLTLVNGGRIITNGNTLKIQANHIVVSGGSFNSFYPPDIRPPDAPEGMVGTKGANGGDLYISANDQIDGVLKVNLSGQNGGRGGSGSAGGAGSQGARGQNGVDGLLDCRSGGSNGAVGGPGGEGKPGAAGGDGGNGGHLFLSKNLLHSTIELIAKGGTPGGGGTGGAGGPGGAGGQGGSGTVHCGGGHGGDNGPNGLPGSNGTAGQPGTDSGGVQFMQD